MEIRQLRTFIAVAEELSFGKAASRLNMTQPSVSLHIKQLENEIGARLLERGGKRDVAITPAGKVFLDGARQTLQAADRARQSAQHLSEGKTGELNIGYSDDFTFASLPSMIESLHTQSPGVQVNLSLKSSYRVIELVKDGLLDLGFVCFPIPRINPNLDMRQLPPTEIVAVISKTHRLAKRKRIWLKELSDTPLYLMPHNVISGFSAQATRLFAQAQITPRLLGTSDNALVTLEMISRGVGATLASLSSLPAGFPDIHILHLRDADPKLELGMVFRKDSPLSVLIQQVFLTLDEAR